VHYFDSQGLFYIFTPLITTTTRLHLASSHHPGPAPLPACVSARTWAESRGPDASLAQSGECEEVADGRPIGAGHAGARARPKMTKEKQMLASVGSKRFSLVFGADCIARLRPVCSSVRPVLRVRIQSVECASSLSSARPVCWRARLWTGLEPTASGGSKASRWRLVRRTASRRRSWSLDSARRPHEVDRSEAGSGLQFASPSELEALIKTTLGPIL